MTKKTILVIEDDLELQTFVEEFLTENNYQILLANNGNEGLAMIEENQLDLILTDLLMPEKDGVRVISDVKANHPEIPIIAMSGGQSVFSPVFLEAANTLGATKTLTKPFRNEELLQTIQDCLKTDD